MNCNQDSQNLKLEVCYFALYAYKYFMNTLMNQTIFAVIPTLGIIYEINFVDQN